MSFLLLSAVLGCKCYTKCIKHGQLFNSDTHRLVCNYIIIVKVVKLLQTLRMGPQVIVNTPLPGLYGV